MGDTDADRDTEPEKPRLVKVSVEVEVPPAGWPTVVGLAVIVKSLR